MQISKAPNWLGKLPPSRAVQGELAVILVTLASTLKPIRETRDSSHSELVVFERSGHFPHVEEPRALVEALRDFLDRNGPAQVDEATWQDRLADGRPDTVEVA